MIKKQHIQNQTFCSQNLNRNQLWFSVAFFGVRVLVTFQLMCVHIKFSSVWYTKLPSFGKELLTRLTTRFFVFRLFVFLVISRLGC